MKDILKILIIDDDPMTLKTLSDILKAKGYEVVTAQNGEKGVAEASQEFVNLALVDLQLPDVTGIEVMGRIKAISPSTEVIILTGHATMVSAIEATNRGAFSYLLKPYDVQQLLLHIHHAIDKQQTEKAFLESEERFRAVAETATDAIVCIEEPGVVYFWNAAAEKMFGYSSVEANGMALHNVITPECFREKACKGMKTFFQTGTGPVIGKTLELIALRKNSTEFPIELSVSAMKIRNKWQATAIIRDISQRKQTEASLLWELKVNTAMADLARLLITSKTIETTSSFVLETARIFTGSEFGFVGYLDPQTGRFVSPTLTTEVSNQCHMKNHIDGFLMPGGLFGWVLKNRKSLLTNSPAEDPRSAGTPSGHIPIHRFLSAPSLLGETLVGQIAVANSGRDYTDKDVQFLERLATLYALAVHHTREEDKLHHEKGLTARLLRLIAEDVDER